MTTNGAVHLANPTPISSISVVGLVLLVQRPCGIELQVCFISSFHFANVNHYNISYLHHEHKEKNFPRNKKSLLQQNTKMFHFLCSPTHVFSFFGFLLYHFVHGRVFGIIDARHCRRKAIDTTSLHCSNQHPWTPQPSHQIHSLVC